MLLIYDFALGTSAKSASEPCTPELCSNEATLHSSAECWQCLTVAKEYAWRFLVKWLHSQGSQ